MVFGDVSGAGQQASGRDGGSGTTGTQVGADQAARPSAVAGLGLNQQGV